ncbi:MAG: succinate dehydrogenase iron-sulfur subunit [Candidatus Bathyarchaeota archaeon]|nr:succinate dehydrogenase iron-sulfur subunit [Candidatus Bathyarchaeota archaeon]
MKLKLKIFRFNPEKEKDPHYDLFTVEAEPTERILDCLNKIRSEQDGSLAYRMSCGHGICGSDGMTINGLSTLACQELVKNYQDEKTIVIEPLSVFAVIKDLVVDLKPFFDREKSVHPKKGIVLKDSDQDKEHQQTIEQRLLFDDDLKCIKCACCVSACPVNQKEDLAYIGPAAIVRAHRYIFDSRIKDKMERLRIMNEPHGAWSCKSYFECTRVCPKKIQVAKHITEIKREILEDLQQEK